MFRHRRLAPFAVLCVSAFGAALSPNSHAIEPAYEQFGALYVMPLLDVEVEYADNIYRAAEGEVDALIIRTSPEINLWLDNQGSIYSLKYRIDDGRYSDDGGFGDDDYTDHQLRGDINHIFNARNRLTAFAEYHRTHEDRGTGLTEGLIENIFDVPIEYDHNSVGARYYFGNWDGKGRVEASYEYHDFEYQNFREEGTRFFDYKQDRLMGTFFWNVSGRSAALLELRYFDTAYGEQRDTVPNVDSEEFQLLLGGEWQASAKTRGSVKLGYFEREFESSLRESDDGFSWDVAVNWQPKTYSIWDLYTRRVSRETNGLGNYISAQEYGLEWRHDFWGRNRLNLDVLFAQNDYRGLELNDERFELRIGAERKVRRWLDVGVAYSFERRTSERRVDVGVPRDFDYERNAIQFTLSVSL